MTETEDPEELQAAILFDDYVTAFQQGKQPSKEECLEKCPDSQKETIEKAIEGFLFMDRYWVPPVKEETVRKCLERLHEIRDRKEKRKHGA